ncbi:hypothetical protein BHM03_00052731 [Ensete ventricosum]|nr:hypothetical protein BHM03_00052731 [Ensete ventricosum]
MKSNTTTRCRPRGSRPIFIVGRERQRDGMPSRVNRTQATAPQEISSNRSRPRRTVDVSNRILESGSTPRFGPWKETQHLHT